MGPEGVQSRDLASLECALWAVLPYLGTTEDLLATVPYKATVMASRMIPVDWKQA